MQEISNPFHGQNYLFSKEFSNFERTSSKNSNSCPQHTLTMKGQNIEEKRNPFHGRFTHKTARFWYAKLMNNRKRAALAARAFKVWKFFRNKVVLPVKQISYFFHFSLLYMVYKWSMITKYYVTDSQRHLCLIKSAEREMRYEFQSSKPMQARKDICATKCHDT